MNFMIPEDINDFLILFTEEDGQATPQHIAGFQQRPKAMEIAGTLKDFYEQDPELFEECFMIQLDREGLLSIFFGEQDEG